VRFRGTWILLLVFLVLGGYVYFAEYRGRDEREQQEAAKKKLFATPPKDVTELSLIFPDHRISAVKKDTRWEITEPQGVDADSSEWDSLVSSLGQIEKDRVVASGNLDVAQFGLDHPAVQVSAKSKDGKTVSVQFGSDNPKKDLTYAKLPEGKEVFLTAVTWSQAFKKSLTDLRNKNVLGFVQDDISSIRIENGKNEIEFQKSGMDWTLKKPAEMKADGPEVSSFLSSIQSARAANFAGPEVTEAQAGLMPPVSKVVLHDSKANTDRVLSIGKSPEKDKYYAKDESRPAIMIIEKEIPAKLLEPAATWRDKTIAHFEQQSIDEVEIARGSEKITVKKQGTDWKLADGRKAQSDKISNALAMLEFERAEQFVDSPAALSTYGLDKPRLEVTLRQTGKDVANLKFGNATHKPEGTYAKAAGPAIMTVTTDLYDKFNLKADDLAEAAPPPAK